MIPRIFISCDDFPLVIMRKLFSAVRNSIFVGLALVSINSARADDLLKGVRGPTKVQFDERIVGSENENDVETITNALVVKYWDGNKLGKFGFINIPYKFVSTQNHSNYGLGDISLGVGARGTTGNLHWFSYLAATFPTGDKEEKPPLGAGRFDNRLGLIGTYLSPDKAYELDVTLELTLTDENNGSDTPNEFYAGLLAGGRVFSKERAGIGFTLSGKDNGDYLLNLRGVGRHTFSPKLHAEVVADTSLYSYNMPKVTSGGIFFRYNY